MTRRWLIPLTPLYRLGLEVRELRLRRGWEPVQSLQSPVISIGNLSTGGAGKTPFTIALARALTTRGLAVDVLSRGYGRTGHHPARVDPTGSADEYGDEPLLTAREGEVPVYVARERHQAGLLAEADVPPAPDPLAKAVTQTPSHSAVILSKGRVAPEVDGPAFRDDHSTGELRHVHILDDGFQHRQLHRDVDILLLNRDDWHDRLLPAGNLREPLNAARRADVIAIPASDLELERELRTWGWNGPVWRLRRHMDVPHAEGPVLAFCGIARPEQFFTGLEAAGLPLAHRIAFRDHHRYTHADIERLRSAARSAGAAALVTTAKDRVRLTAQISSLLQLPLLTAGLSIEIQQLDTAIGWLTRRLHDATTRVSL